MTITVDHHIDEIDCDVTITDVDECDRVLDLFSYSIVDVYLKTAEGNTINLELSSEAAYLLWAALGASKLVLQERADRVPDADAEMPAPIVPDQFSVPDFGRQRGDY
jgi:hypothetical protein